MAEQPASSTRAVRLVDDLIKYIDSNKSTYIPYTDVSTKKRTHALAPSVCIVRETKIINNNIDDVWNVIKPLTFPFAGDVKSVKILPDNSSPFNVGNVREITYNDGTKQSIKIVEISNLEHSVKNTVFSSEPRY